ATQSEEPVEDVSSSVPSQPLSPPILADSSIASSELLPVNTPSSSMFPLDVAQSHSQQLPVSAAPLASNIGAGLPTVPTAMLASAAADASSGALASEDEDVAEESVTMATAPLPFPPFGGPQHQQEPQLSADSLGASVTPELAALPTASSGGLMETIAIVSAANDNALESSIDAILHSVIQDYKTESIPKAAVGFALIHPRRQAAASGRH
ncbi:hypothetical protein GGF44_005506, partial [Coemansia sp. RSA 1694]